MPVEYVRAVLSSTSVQALELQYPSGDTMTSHVNEAIRNALRPIAHTRPKLHVMREMLVPFLRSGCFKSRF